MNAAFRVMPGVVLAEFRHRAYSQNIYTPTGKTIRS